MKILKKYILGSALSLLLLSQVACKKEFLEITPKGKQIAVTTKDYELILNANSLSTSSAGAFMGDDIAALRPYFAQLTIRKQRLFKYESRVYESDQLPDELSGGETYINRLYLFNKIINEVMESKGGTDAQKRAILAEARAGRAICNFMFLSDFTTPYMEATAATELGIPNLIEADVTLTEFKRLTKQESYDLIIKDLKEAMPELGPLVHRRKISKIAAQFYLARIYFAMRKYELAHPILDEALLEKSKSTIDLDLYDYNKVLDPADSETWFPLLFGLVLANQPLPAENIQQIYDITVSVGDFTGGGANGFVLSPQTMNLFDPLDKRPNLFDNMEWQGDSEFPLKMRRSIGFFTSVGPSVSDLYLMRAECRARANNLAGAVADVQLLREKRSGNPNVPGSVANNQEALVRYILDERIREFAFTGLRWLDMRRLYNEPVYGSHVKMTHEVRTMADTNNDGVAGDISETHTLKPERFALKFGERMLRESKGLEENQ
ncbi:RagB/SusD family nutrient uptake outer membrane protein [Pedobacter nyackensis]|uniref:RagB/SusD family nutrient uptake outer membrane protein n=1 Tax=Pedobacter nyackensis TaxID=475255 RepID=UPI00292F4ABC|nr:RagB/SusD family nutrient uptake outer membrane protein [Pedobacter nyackensis]